MRVLGWIVCAAGLIYFAAAFFAAKRSPSLPRLTEGDLARIAVAAERERGDLLSELADRLAPHNVQVLLMQGVPASPALVLAAENDSSGDETVTHWPSPWLKLNRVLGASPREPTIVRDVHAGRRYVHHVYPVNTAENHYLVVTELAVGPRHAGWFRWLVLAISLLLGTALWFIQDER